MAYLQRGATIFPCHRIQCFNIGHHLHRQPYALIVLTNLQRYREPECLEHDRLRPGRPTPTILPRGVVVI